MEPKSASLGSSIHVPCVQELAKGPLATIPNRYVCSNQEPSIKDDHTLSPNIPVINLQNLLTGDSKNIELQKLHGACKEWGFFQLTNHGVSSTLMNKVKLEIKNLFDLPMEEKKKLWQERGDLQGFGQLFVVSEKQKLDWADLFYMMVLPTQMRKPDLFSRLPSCVQELAKELATTVPPRYVQPEQEPLTTVYPTSPHIPIIDMANLISGNDEELQKLDFACKEWGFFQLVNHGVSSSLIEKVKLEIQEFFNLPMEEKKKFWQKTGEVEGFGQAFVVSEEQKLDWGDIFFLTTLPANLRKPHLFPKLPIPFRYTLESYSIELKQLVLKLLENMAKALKMNPGDMKELFEEGLQAMRMNYYPPCPEPEKVMGLTPHADSVGLTILLQINEVQGLQVKKDGMWIPIKPLDEAFIINIGDILQIVTNGVYQSIEHRAVVNSSKERLSIATFYNPKYDGDMGPAPSLITPQSPAMYKRLSVEEYVKGLFARELKGKYLDAMRIEKESPQ